MAALFTGRTPSIESGDRRLQLHWNGSNWCGLARFADRDDERCVPGAVPTLAEQMRIAGYTTLGATANELLHEAYVQVLAAGDAALLPQEALD